MSYNQGGYSQQSQQGYGQYNPYGQSGNPYGQSGNPYGSAPQGGAYPQQQQPYGHTGNYSERPDLEHQSSSRYDEENAQGGSYEMSNMNGRDPNRILNEIRNLDQSIDQVEAEVQRLRGLHRAYLDTTDTNRDNPLRKEIERLTGELMEKYRGLVLRSKNIRKDPESGPPRNKAQVGKVDRRIKTAMNQYQQCDREFRQQSKEQMERQYRIVRPDASEAEVREAVEDSNGQIFSQALISADRRGEAQRAAMNVQTRHEDIQKIERDMAELAQLFNDLEALVVQQEPAVTQIEEKGMEASGHVAQANTELDGAVKKARAARRKKWWCLGIALLIIIIIVVVVVVAVLVTKKS